MQMQFYQKKNWKKTEVFKFFCQLKTLCFLHFNTRTFITFIFAHLIVIICNFRFLISFHIPQRIVSSCLSFYIFSSYSYHHVFKKTLFFVQLGNKKKLNELCYMNDFNMSPFQLLCFLLCFFCLCFFGDLFLGCLKLKYIFGFEAFYSTNTNVEWLLELFNVEEGQ